MVILQLTHRHIFALIKTNRRPVRSFFQLAITRASYYHLNIIIWKEKPHINNAEYSSQSFQKLVG